MALSNGRFISNGFSIGASACSSRFFARPSQKKNRCSLTFIDVGVFLVPALLLTPRLTADVSANANAGLWQLAQLILRVDDSIGSKNNLFPSSSLVTG